MVSMGRLPFCLIYPLFPLNNEIPLGDPYPIVPGSTKIEARTQMVTLFIVVPLW
jgi:hypothetical protein